MEKLATTTLKSQENSHFVMNSLLQTDGTAAISDVGSGRPILLLHGGGGTGTVFGLSQALAAKARVLLPTHPGFDGTPRPAHLDSVPELAASRRLPSDDRLGQNTHHGRLLPTPRQRRRSETRSHQGRKASAG